MNTKTKLYREYKVVPKNITPSKTIIYGDNDAVKIVKDIIGEDINVREVAVLLLLSTQLELLGYSILSIGGTSGTVIDIKLVNKLVADTLCHGIILAHNHPNGALKASKHDLDITQKLSQYAKAVSIDLFSSLIITNEGYINILENINVTSESKIY